MGDECRIGYNVTLHREHGHSNGQIHIGSGVLLADNVKIDYSGEVAIHDNVWISEGVHIHTHEHPIYPGSRSLSQVKSTPTYLVINEGAWIGDSAIILPSCHYIGANSIVGAGAIVTKDVQDFTCVAGNPAVLVKRIDEKADS